MAGVSHRDSAAGRGGLRQSFGGDGGPGIPLAEQASIWHGEAEGKGVEGLGMGLYLCRSIIERHRGRAGVQRAPGQGSTYWFTLPLDTRERAKGRSNDEQAPLTWD